MTPRGLECELWLLALSWCAGYRLPWRLFEPILVELATASEIRAKA